MKAAAGFSLAAIAALGGACTSMRTGSATFAGTTWHVAAIDNAETGDASAYYASFSRDRITARFGCNYFSSRYRIADEKLIVQPGTLTRMACRRSGEAQERRALATLNQPMAISWSSGRRLTLHNPAGSIRLERSGRSNR